MYVTADDKATFATAFDMSSVPIVSHEQALAEERAKKLTSATPTLKAPSTGPKKQQANGTADKAAAAVAAAQKHAQALLQIPELKAHGPLLSSSQSIELTESETEYVVTAIKHIYKDHIVIQYDLKNTIANTIIEDITIVATPSEEDASLEEEFIVPVAKLGTDELGTVFVSFKKVGDTAYPVTSFTNVLKFTSKEIDPSSGEADETGYEDEYQAEDLELVGSDYVQPAFAGSFDHVWETTGANGEEAEETLQLSGSGSIAGMLLPLGEPDFSVIHAPSWYPLNADTHNFQTQRNNSDVRCPSNLWTAQTLPSPQALTRSNSMARRLAGVKWLLSSRWPFLRGVVLRRRLL